MSDNTKVPGQPVCGDSDCNSCERWPESTPPAMNAAHQRHIPDAECVQAKCARPTTGCWGECSLKRNPVVFAMNAASPTATPAGIYYSKLLDNFYDMESECGKGADFHGKWYERRAEFPDESSGSGAAPVGQGSAPADYSQCCDTPNMCSGSRCCTLHDRPWSGQGSAALDSQRWSKEADMIESWSGSATSGEAVEAVAKAIYRLFDGADEHPWREGGNSHKQDDARRYARAALAAKAEQSNTSVPRVGGITQAQSDAITRAANRLGALGYTGISADLREAFAPPVAERAAAPASVPEGFALVPTVLTPDMHMVFSGPILQGKLSQDANQRTWSRVISAAPEVAQPAAQGESIDTPAWRELFKLWDSVVPGVDDEEAIMQRIIANVHSWGAKRAPGSAAQQEVWEFVAMLSLQSGGELNGNRLSARAKELLAKMEAPAPTAGEPSACPTCPKKTPYGPAICGKCVEAGESSAEPAGIDLALRADFDAFLASTQGIVTGEKWPSIEVKKAWMVWQACAEALATRPRAEGGMQDTTADESVAAHIKAIAEKDGAP